MRAAQNVRSANRQVAVSVLPTITLSIKVISALVARVFMIVNNSHALCVNCCKCNGMPLSPSSAKAGVKGWQPEPSLPSCRGERRCGGMTAKLNMFNYILFIVITLSPAYATPCADTSAIAPAALLRIIARREIVVSGHERKKSCFAIIISCPEINI